MDPLPDIPGFNPEAFVGPHAELAKAIFATGWGLDGPGEALLFIGRRPDSSLFSQGVAYLDFASGAGVRGLVQYMQDFFFFSNNGLLYEFHGLTKDGRHFISVRYPVSVPFLMEIQGITLPPNNVNPSAMTVEWPSDFEQQRQVIEAYNGEALNRFEQMSDSDAFPNLALLDQMVQSIEVSKP